MKPIIGIIGGLLITTMLVTPANAQRRVCVFDERRDEVVCGRAATQDEIEERYGGGRRDRDYDYDRRRNDRGNREDVYREIDAVFREVLARRADEGALRSYSDRILSGDWDVRRVREDIANSGEARNRINQLYREILRRDGDPRGIRAYQEALARGASLNDVRRDLLDSEEARRVRR